VKIAILAALLVWGAAVLSPAAAQDNDSPYLTLYLKRWEIAKLEVERARIELANEERTLERYRPLVARHVISRQRFEAQELAVQVARLEVDELRARASEAESLYDVTRLRIENGLDVPVCPEGE
jgi:multidrug resistance efflux pump